MTWPHGAAAVGAVLALVYSGAAVRSPVENDTTIPALEAELRLLARVLPRDGRIGYLEHPTRRTDADVVRTFYVARYALAPRVLVPNTEPPFLIVIRDHAAPDDPRLDGYRLFADVPGGHRVFLRTAP
jgi:hypothetical protein